jgi:hypothetical protein
MHKPKLFQQIELVAIVLGVLIFALVFVVSRVHG